MPEHWRAEESPMKETDYGRTVVCEPTTIGIDPGGSGGIAIMRGDQVEAHKMPKTARDLWYLLAGLDPATCWIEKVHATPQQGVVSAFKFGYAAGVVHQAATCAGLRIEIVTPQKWQKHHGLIVKGRGLGQDDTSKKNRNKAKAQELFPQLRITHAIADALLIAEYGRANAVLHNPGRPASVSPGGVEDSGTTNNTENTER